MKFTTVFAVLATLATAVSATFSDAPLLDTNAKRFASGMGTPLPPVRRGKKPTPTYGGKKGYPSGSSGINNSCNGGTIQCCDSVTNANSEVRDLIVGLVGVVVGPDVACGFTCSPLTAVGLSSGSCTSQAVCCENNSFNGLVAIGCSPININLV